MFTLLEMIMRSSTASGSTRLQALHLLTCLTHPSVYPPAAVAAQSWGATLPLLGAVVTSSKVFKTTNWGFKSLAVATKLMVMLAYQVSGLAEGWTQRTAGGAAVSTAALLNESAGAAAVTSRLAGPQNKLGNDHRHRVGRKEGVILERQGSSSSSSSTMRGDRGGDDGFSTGCTAKKDAGRNEKDSSGSSSVDVSKGDRVPNHQQSRSSSKSGKGPADGCNRAGSSSGSKEAQHSCLTHSRASNHNISSRLVSKSHKASQTSRSKSKSLSACTDGVNDQGYYLCHTFQKCRLLQLQQEGLSWAARHCLCNVLTSFLHTAELLGSLLENRSFWRTVAAACDAAAVQFAKHTLEQAGAEGVEGGSGIYNACSRRGGGGGRGGCSGGSGRGSGSGGNGSGIGSGSGNGGNSSGNWQRRWQWQSQRWWQWQQQWQRRQRQR
jgi:hypothetical protein